MTIALCLPVIAEPDVTSDLQPVTATETPVDAASEFTENAFPVNSYAEETVPSDIPAPIEYKQPMSRKKLAKMFILAMAGVAVSSILLYVILTIYNKIRDSFINGSDSPAPQNETSLTTPDNLTEAVKTFLDKTKW